MNGQSLWKSRMKAVEENREHDWYRELDRDDQRTVEDWWAMESDAHSCRANADPYGVCQVCGAIVPGTAADYDIHGYDP